jgi:hypothetical protein
VARRAFRSPAVFRAPGDNRATLEQMFREIQEALRTPDFMLLGEATADGSSLTLAVTDIPQTHRDLRVLFHGHHDGGGGSNFRALDVRFNSDSGAHYHGGRTVLTEAGATSTATQVDATSLGAAVIGNGAFNSSFELTAHSYSQSVVHGVEFNGWSKIGTTFRTRSGAGSFDAGDPITSVQLIAATDEIAAGSLLVVYGVGLL